MLLVSDCWGWGHHAVPVCHQHHLCRAMWLGNLGKPCVFSDPLCWGCWGGLSCTVPVWAVQGGYGVCGIPCWCCSALPAWVYLAMPGTVPLGTACTMGWRDAALAELNESQQTWCFLKQSHSLATNFMPDQLWIWEMKPSWKEKQLLVELGEFTGQT